MPASPASVDLTNRYRSTLLTMREGSARFAAQALLTLDLRDVDASFDSWRSRMVEVVEEQKRQGVLLTDAYLAAFIGSELGEPSTPAEGVDPDEYMNTEDGRSLDAALLTPLFTIKAARASGRRDAVRLGVVRATRIVSEEVLGAPRRALGKLIVKDTRVSGWTRVTGSGPCGACLAQAGTVNAPDTPFRRHGHCRCIREAVVRGVPQTYRRPTGREVFDTLSPKAQAALFHGRGGEEKADLVRSGAVPLAALVRHEPMRVTPDQYTETSLADLRALTNRP